MVASQSAPASSPPPVRQVLLVTAAVYVGYSLAGLLGLPNDLRFVALVASFYFLPGYMLRRDLDRQRRYQLGPDGVIPPWSWRALKVASAAALVIFPIFALVFWWFYARVCAGDLAAVQPAVWLETFTPWEGGLERFFVGLCKPHNGAFLPDDLVWPGPWRQYGGLGVLLAAAVEVFAIALPEEVFHRGYLMSALEERWPPKHKLLGVPFGFAAVASSALFAVGHLVGMAETARLATFFPALLFAWLWRRSGSLWAPALVHAGSNLLMQILLASTFPP